MDDREVDRLTTLLDQHRVALRAAQDKLAIFQAHRNPDDPTRLAGMDYTELMHMIDDILSPPHPQ